jgi:hypothetical protein
MTEAERKEKKRISDKKYRETHKEQIKAMHKAWRDKNREKLNAQAREKYKENPQPFKERKAKYVASHQEQIKEANRRYKVENRQKCTDYERNKRHNDPIYKFRSRLISLLNQYTKGKGYKGNKTTYEILGCDFNFFLEYIQSKFQKGMTLENYGHGEGKWNIDHIEPISNAKTDEDLEKLNHYTNLQPMWASDNYKKSKKIL